jgi:hypothetical protein
MMDERSPSMTRDQPDEPATERSVDIAHLIEEKKDLRSVSPRQEPAKVHVPDVTQIIEHGPTVRGK